MLRFTAPIPIPFLSPISVLFAYKCMRTTLSEMANKLRRGRDALGDGWRKCILLTQLITPQEREIYKQVEHKLSSIRKEYDTVIKFMADFQR